MKQFFLTSSAADVLDNIINHLSKAPSEYKVAFIPTASEVYKEKDCWWIRKDKEKLIDLGFKLIEFSLTNLKQSQLKKKLKNIDIIFVCGGNVFYSLDKSIKSGFDKILFEKSKNNLIYIGSSAGSMIPGKHIELVSTLDDHSKAPDLKSDGIGLIDIAILPHWGNPKFKEEYFSGFDSFYNIEAKVIPIRDNQYLLIENNSQKIIQV